MQASATSQQILEYVNQLNKTEQHSVLQILKTYLINRKEGFQSPSLEEYSKELELADAEIEAGHFIIHEEVKKYFDKK